MPKVLRIINRFNLGGPTYNAALLSRHLPPEYETLLIGGEIEPSEGSSDHILNDLQVDFMKIPEMRRSVNPLKDLKALKKIKSIIRDFQPDIVHTHASKAGAVGRKAAHSLNVPVIVHTFHGHVFHSYFSDAKSKLYQKIERDLAAKSNAIVAISELQKEELVNQYHICKPEKMHVIPLGFDLSKFQGGLSTLRSKFRTEHGLSEDAIAIGIIGRLVPIKNHEMFIQVMEQVMSKIPHVHAFIIGDGELKQELVAKVVDGPNKERFHFTSWITDIERALAGLDVVAMTSLNEGTPVSIIEAKASGKPVVSTNVGGVSDILGNTEAGFLCQKGDIQGFTSKIESLVEDRTLREKMGTAGRAEVLQKYHYKRLCGDMDVLYKSLLSSKGVN